MTTPAQFGSDGCTCRPFTRQTDPPRFLRPGDSVDMISGWQRAADCAHHAPEAERDEDAQAPPGWTQLEARAFNAVLPALRQAGEWLPLSARRAVAKAVLAELKPELDDLAQRIREAASVDGSLAQ